MKIRTALTILKPGNLLNHRLGYCSVCSKRTIFFINGSLETIRNHAPCLYCRSCSRYRHMAKTILETYRERGIETLADFKNHPDIVVFNTISTGPIVKRMGKGANIICSEYFDDTESGQIKNGVLCQDLQKLTLMDDSIDLVISEDVFEHIPDYRAAFGEVYRVLKNGGHHIFSIPFYFGEKTRDLFEVKNGKRVLFETVEYHGDPVRGLIPCYTRFGYDVLDFIRQIGFEARLEISRYEDEVRFGTFDCFTFITRKS